MSANTAPNLAFGLLSAGVVAGGLFVGVWVPIASADPVAPIPAPVPAVATVTPIPAAPAAATMTPVVPSPAAAAPSAATGPTAVPAAATSTPTPGTPGSPVADGCQASQMTQTVADVAENAAKYLEQHPDVDQAFTDIKSSPQDQMLPKTQAYLSSRPDVAGQFMTIAAPLNAMRDKCGLPIDLAGFNPAAAGVNPALLTALSQNPAAQQVAQNPLVQQVIAPAVAGPAAAPAATPTPTPVVGPLPGPRT